MWTWRLVAILLSWPGLLCAEETIEVPSGQTVTFLDVVHEAPGPDGLTYRFRFVAPAIARVGGTVGSDQALEDMAALCESYALPRLAALGPQPSQIIISLADRAVPFGQPDPEATQFFEAFRPEGSGCVWEGF